MRTDPNDDGDGPVEEEDLKSKLGQRPHTDEPQRFGCLYLERDPSSMKSWPT